MLLRKLMKMACRTHSPIIATITLTSLLVLLCSPLTQQQRFRPPPSPPSITFTCEKITQIDTCADVGYNLSSFPNFRDHPDQQSANQELLNFSPLIRGVCSNAIVHFLCSIYAPFCQIGRENLRIRPCRELCLHVRSTCEQPLNDFNLQWPPHLECDMFPLNSSTTELSFCPRNITMLRVPSNVPTDPMSTGSVTLQPPVDTSLVRPTVVTTCLTCLNLTTNLVNESHEFGGICNCGVRCSGIYFSAPYFCMMQLLCIVTIVTSCVTP